MIQGKWFAPDTDPIDAVAIRKRVFNRGTDALDSESWNVVVYEDESPVATGRIWWKDGAYRLGDICVPEELRGRRLGDLVLRLLLFKAQTHSAREVRLSCDASVSGFFARLGFLDDVSGSGLTEMLLPGDRIELDTCRNCHKQNCPNRK